MSRGQIAILPVPDGRRAERRIVNLAARLRDPGATTTDVDVVNLSATGFMARGDLRLEPDAHVWLKLSGLEPQNCRCVWVNGHEAGFEFATPLHAATMEMMSRPVRKVIPRNHFGLQHR